MRITEEQLATLTDDEIVAIIVEGRRILQQRFDAQRKKLDAEHAGKLRAIEGNSKRTKGRKQHAVSQTA